MDQLLWINRLCVLLSGEGLLFLNLEYLLTWLSQIACKRNATVERSAVGWPLSFSPR